VKYFALIKVQLWSSPMGFEIENKRWTFHQIMNRFVLAEDSKELLDEGGIDLIKAIKKKIVVGRAPPAPSSPNAGGKVSGKPGTADHGVVQAAEKEYCMYFRGASVPFEMVTIHILSSVWYL
jgi:hypothetical protein